MNSDSSRVSSSAVVKDVFFIDCNELERQLALAKAALIEAKIYFEM